MPRVIFNSSGRQNRFLVINIINVLTASYSTYVCPPSLTTAVELRSDTWQDGKTLRWELLFVIHKTYTFFNPKKELCSSWAILNNRERLASRDNLIPALVQMPDSI